MKNGKSKIYVLGVENAILPISEKDKIVIDLPDIDIFISIERIKELAIQNGKKLTVSVS